MLLQLPHNTTADRAGSIGDQNHRPLLIHADIHAGSARYRLGKAWYADAESALVDEFRWLAIDDQNVKNELAQLIRTAGTASQAQYGHLVTPSTLASGQRLLETLERIPLYLAACLHGCPGGGNGALSAFYGLVYPAVWSLRWRYAPVDSAAPSSATTSLRRPKRRPDLHARRRIEPLRTQRGEKIHDQSPQQEPRPRSCLPCSSPGLLG